MYTARTAAINNSYGCDPDELSLSFIITILQAEGKSDHKAVSQGFSISWELMTIAFVYKSVESSVSTDNEELCFY